MFKKSIVFAVSFFLTCFLVISSASAGSISIILGSPGIPGTWYVGDTPQNLDYEKPVILFVQGLNSSASTWWDSSQMYQTAYSQGYQTAFVELNDSAGTPKNMWNNGQLLAELIEKVHKYFQKKVVIVAHSKGGIDTQAALIHYGAYPYVSHVITIGSPHYGSQVADLAYSAWAGWIATIIGQKNEATYSLQTGYMNYFRSITDSNENVSENKYYTLTGDGWNSNFFHPLFAGGLYLSAFGKNDGLVTVNNSYLPYGNMIKIGPWNHEDELKGSKTFSVFQPFLAVPTSSKATLKLVAEKSKRNQESKSDSIVRGGSFSNEANEEFLVEDHVKEMTIDWISANPVSEVEVFAPSSKKQKAKVETFQDASIFKGAWHHVMKIKNPKQGTWKLHVDGQDKEKNAYLMTVHYDSKVSDRINLNMKKGTWSISGDDHLINEEKVQVEYQVEYTADSVKKQKGKSAWMKKAKVQGTDTFDIPLKEAGVYNVTVDIHGKTVDGVPFERTVIQSIYVDDKGNQY